jgi:hypothetical protein
MSMFDFGHCAEMWGLMSQEMQARRAIFWQEGSKYAGWWLAVLGWREFS